MRTPLIAGNWKMNLNRAESTALAKAVADGVKDLAGIDVAVFPPALYVDAVRAVLAGTKVLWGTQNVCSEQKPGAFTGEISATMLADLGCRYVIVGHSERRHIYGETDADVNKKTQAALAAGIGPVVCVGELLEERQGGKTAEVIRRQFLGSLAGLTVEQMEHVVIAYEPVWAIGTGLTATPAQAEEVHADLRKLLTERYNGSLAERTRILYGGSVKADNAAELMSQPNVDGALVGGASLKAADFLKIIAGARR
jgi:triosephosphate isomerase (TIM)